MKTSQLTTLAGLCVLLAGTATAAFAQDNGSYGDHHGSQGGYGQNQFGQHQFDPRQDGDYRHTDQYRHAGASERRRLDRLHAAYARAATHGNYNAAERDHLHAQAIRARLRARLRAQRGDQRGDQYRGNDHFQGGDHQGDQGNHRGDQPQHDNH